MEKKKEEKNQCLDNFSLKKKNKIGFILETKTLFKKT